MRRALLISPHFPPDTSAGTHRARLLAPHLARHGWEPTVLTLTPESYEGTLDPELLGLVPADLRVERCPALPARRTRRFGVGDLGLRALPGLHRAAGRLLAAERYEVVWITVYPTYPALLGPLLKARFGVRFVLDYQDPWVGSWGETVGGGPGGAVDARSFLSRRLAERLEPWAARAADAITAVSAGTWEALFARHPELAARPTAALPLGGEPADFEAVRVGERNAFFDPGDGDLHLVYVGTLLPLGFETLRALLAAVREVVRRRPAIGVRLRLHFIGTSNQTDPHASARVLPEAERAGVAQLVREHPSRVPYVEALRLLTQAHAILLLGSSEPHYTPSKAYPALLAGRPILAAYHEASEVVPLLARSPGVEVVTYGERRPARESVGELAAALASVAERAAAAPPGGAPAAAPDLGGHDAATLAGRLAALFDRISG
jgi:hypothetical protein